MPKTSLFFLFVMATFGPVVVRGADPPQPRPENVSTADPRTPEEEKRGFHLPEGFEIELVAAEPEIRKPLNLAFDDRGRLWVTETIEYPYPAAEGTTPRDGVKVLEDFGPDGRARTIRTFADGLNIPIGILPLPGGDSALVHSIPNIFRLSDSNGDGRADRREVYYSPFGSKDTHGMTNAFTWGFDGWIYACHGFANSSTVRGSDRSSVAMQSGNVYRMRPDGTHLEQVTHGQVNPFGLAFDPLGNLYSCDCHSRPIYQLLRGGWYPSFGKPHDGLGFAPEMTTNDHGSTAISGISYYAADQFPEPFRGTAFIGNVMTNRINHDRIEWHGTTPRAVLQPDFLWSEDNWFRPVDIELGPDGALYVADFYNRIIGHYEVPLTHPGRDRERGRIWRIVYRGPEGNGGQPPVAVATRGGGPNATREALIADLGHPNLAVRMMAANQLASRPPDLGLKAIATADDNPWRRVHALWVLQRQGILDEETLKRIAEDPSEAVRAHAICVLGERSALTGPLHDLAMRALSDADPLVRRNAAEALGHHPDPVNIRPLLGLRRAAPSDDTHLIHAVRMALRDQLRPDSAWAYLDGMELSEGDARDVADVAVGVPSSSSARFLVGHIRRVPALQDRQVRFVHHIARYGDETMQPELTAFIADQRGEGPSRQAALLKASQQGTQERGGSPSADARNLALDVSRTLLDSAKGDEVRAGIQLASTFTLKELQDRLTGLAREKGAEDSSRTAAMTAMSVIAPEAALPVLGQILGDPSDPIPLREQAAVALGAGARPGAQEALLAVLPTAPGRLQTAIAAALAARPAGAEALLDAVAAGKASARALQEPKVVAALGQAKLPDLKGRLDPLLKGLPPSDERLRLLLGRRRLRFEQSNRDPALGAQVFEKNCMACHQFQGKGARVGPQLEGIGARGVDRLVEDLLDPNRNVDQAFRTTQLALTDGRLVSGLLLREEGEVLVLADSQGKEVRVTRDTVDEQSLSQLSPMPANFAEQIAEDDFYHLLAYLLTTQPSQTERPQDNR